MDKIITLTKQYKKEMKEVYDSSYPSLTGDFVEFWYEDLLSFEDTIGYLHNDVLASVLQIQPLEIYLNRLVWKVGAIGGVATLPQARNNGFAGKLLAKSLEEMRNRKMHVSMLAPFSYEYYRKYGWELAMTKIKYTIPIKAFRKFNKKGDMSRIENADHAVISRIYETYAEGMNLMMHESSRRWEHFILLGGIGYLMGLKDRIEAFQHSDDEGNIDGYVIFALVGDKLHVLQLAALKHTAMESIFNFLCGYARQIKDVCWSAPPSVNMHSVLDNPHFNAEIHPSMMFRVVDVRESLLFNKFPEDIALCVTFRIDDTYVAWNQEPINLTIAGGKAFIDSNPKVSTVNCSIQTFSQIFCGFVSFEQAVSFGKALYNGTPEAMSQLCKTFPVKSTNIDFGF